MRYLGSKFKMAKYICPILQSHLKDGMAFYDVFSGAMNIVQNIKCDKRFANDIHPYVIACYRGLVYEGFIPPSSLTRDEYYDVKLNKCKYSDAMIGFVGFGGSFSGKWFTAYAQDTAKRQNYCLESYNKIMKQKDSLQGVIFSCGSYDSIEFEPNSLIYCDPPYRNTERYKYNIDHDKFYAWCREKAKEGHTVIVSELDMPDDFECIWQKERNLCVNFEAKNRRLTEKLWKPRCL